MDASVRIVCRKCLRSVEVSLDSEETRIRASPCPYCGEAIDGQTSSIEPSVDGSGVVADRAGRRTAAARVVRSTGRRHGIAARSGRSGRFQLRERLGEGGFGEVFLAYDPRLDRDVAIKLLKQTNPNARAMESILPRGPRGGPAGPPNIVAVHDAGFDNGRCWVAYQHVVGRPLRMDRERQRMDAITAARIIRALADALDHAHRMGVVHRDIKPANVIIDDLGRPRLIDFGLARRSDLESDLTREGAVVGTPAYMSPEQAMGRSRDVDEPSRRVQPGCHLLASCSEAGFPPRRPRSPRLHPQGPSIAAGTRWKRR